MTVNDNTCLSFSLSLCRARALMDLTLLFLSIKVSEFSLSLLLACNRTQHGTPTYDVVHVRPIIIAL